jgi:hypothetical protein
MKASTARSVQFGATLLLKLCLLAISVYLVIRFGLESIAVPIAILWLWHGYRLSLLTERIAGLERRLQQVDKDALSANLHISNAVNGTSSGPSNAGA